MHPIRSLAVNKAATVAANAITGDEQVVQSAICGYRFRRVTKELSSSFQLGPFASESGRLRIHGEGDAAWAQQTARNMAQIEMRYNQQKKNDR